MQALLLIFKHAMFLRHSNRKKESALNLAGLSYQKGDIDLKIQDYLKASFSEPPVEEITSFIIATDIGMFIVALLFSYLIKVFSSISVYGSARRRSLVDKILRNSRIILRNIARKSGFNVVWSGKFV